MEWYWLIHHTILLEPLEDPIETRIAYIRANKPCHEIETRLRWMRPVQHPERIPLVFVEAAKAYGEARKAYEDEIASLHAEECPGCPWDGKQLVFPHP